MLNCKTLNVPKNLCVTYNSIDFAHAADSAVTDVSAYGFQSAVCFRHCFWSL